MRQGLSEKRRGESGWYQGCLHLPLDGSGWVHINLVATFVAAQAGLVWGQLREPSSTSSVSDMSAESQMGKKHPGGIKMA